MATPQAGIFALGTRYHHHLELDLTDGATDTDVMTALAAIREPHVTAGATNLVVGFGADLWRRLGPATAPDGIGPFEPIDGRDDMHAPATQHDLWVWAHGSGTDAVLDTAVAVTAVLAPVATLAAETSCFVYHDSRDLTGFIDGSANPAPSAAPEVAIIPDGHPGAGGSHVIAQRWVHDLDGFGRLDVADQERVFGRTKLDSQELPDDVRSADAHISLAEVHDAAGEERPIYRRSTPYGSAAERGLFFLAFSAERDRFDQMLGAIFGVEDAAVRDRLLDFSTPVSGSFYFAPSLDELAALGVAEA